MGPMSAYGPKRIFHHVAFDVAFGGKADMAYCSTNVCFCPKADIVQPLNDLCLTHPRPFQCASLGGYDALSRASGEAMRRREFIKIIAGSAAAAWPLAAHAQRPAKPVIGFLGPASPSTFASRIEAFRLGLRDFGYVEGTNI